MILPTTPCSNFSCTYWDAAAATSVKIAHHSPWDYPAAAAKPHKLNHSHQASFLPKFKPKIKKKKKKSINFRKGSILPETIISCKNSLWKQMWTINIISLSNHRIGCCHCSENIAKPVHVLKKVFLKPRDCCDPSLLPLKKGKRTINITCCSISQSSRSAGSVEDPAWVIKHRSMILYHGVFPHIMGWGWAKLDLIL